MTREEAIEYLKRADITVGQEVKTKMAEALEMAISALSENNGDLISRQAVINAIANTCFWLSADNWKELTKCINSISSVKNKGEWRPIYQGDEIIDYRCNKCDFGSTFGRGKYRFNFCPNCGADMRGGE